jgi:hypothetical protein
MSLGFGFVCDQLILCYQDFRERLAVVLGEMLDNGRVPVGSIVALRHVDLSPVVVAVVMNHRVRF